MRYANGSTPTKYQFTGQYSFAGEFGLLDYKARYYDPQLGRFAAPDTITPQGQGVQAWDRYAYANNSPVVYNDPSGHCVYGATANSTGINWAAACSSIGNYAYQFAARVYNNVATSAPVAGNVSSTLASFGAGYYNAAAGYYGSVYSYAPPASTAFYSYNSVPSLPKVGLEPTANLPVPPPPEGHPTIPEGTGIDGLQESISDDHDSAEFRYLTHKNGAVYWQYKLRWQNGSVVRIHQGIPPWADPSEVKVNVGYDVLPGTRDVTPFVTDLGITEYVYYTQKHILLNTTLYELIRFFGFGWTP